MSLLKRFAELYLNQPMLLSAGLLPELSYPVASWALRGGRASGEGPRGSGARSDAGGRQRRLLGRGCGLKPRGLGLCLAVALA